jgi:hypothetical protein
MFKTTLKINTLLFLKQWKFLTSSALSIALLAFSMEAYAFSQPLVTKTREIVGHATTIAQSVIGIGIVWFIFTLLMSRPNFRILVCTTFAGVMIAGFATFVGFFGGR